jgi:hypothetical protein
VLACGVGARIFCGWAGSRFLGWFFSGARFRAPRRRPCAFLVLLRRGPFFGLGFGAPSSALCLLFFGLFFLGVFLLGRCAGFGDFDRIFVDIFRYF